MQPFLSLRARAGLAGLGRRVEESHHVRRLSLVALRTIRQRYPRLLATGPEVHRRSQPRGVVQGAAAHIANCRAGSWATGNPRPTFRTCPAGCDVSAIGGALDPARLPRNKAKGVSRK